MTTPTHASFPNTHKPSGKKKKKQSRGGGGRGRQEGGEKIMEGRGGRERKRESKRDII